MLLTSATAAVAAECVDAAVGVSSAHGAYPGANSLTEQVVIDVVWPREDDIVVMYWLTKSSDPLSTYAHVDDEGYVGWAAGCSEDKLACFNHYPLVIVDHGSLLAGDNILSPGLRGQTVSGAYTLVAEAGRCMIYDALEDTVVNPETPDEIEVEATVSFFRGGAGGPCQVEKLGPALVPVDPYTASYGPRVIGRFEVASPFSSICDDAPPTVEPTAVAVPTMAPTISPEPVAPSFEPVARTGLLGALWELGPRRLLEIILNMIALRQANG